MSSSLNPAIRASTAATSFISISLVVFLYDRALLPLYGSGPTRYLLHNILLATILVAAFLPPTAPTTLMWLSALSLSLAPNATRWVAVLTSRRGDPMQGTVITHLAVLAPLILSLTTSVLNLGRKTGSFISSAVILGLCGTAATVLPGALLQRISFLNLISEGSMFLALAGVMWSLWILNHPFSFLTQRVGVSLPCRPFKGVLLIAFIAFWWGFHPYMLSPVLPHPLGQTYTHPKVPLQILSSVQSTTGLIVVGEALPSPDGETQQLMPPLRYLRASHSLLGGVWMGDRIQMLDEELPLNDSFGVALGDSVYGAFVLQDAVRLVNSTERGQIEPLENALIIGLGIGTSATAFMRHGISTTIVEIDPAVYDAARTFFGLPDPGSGRVHLQDASRWVAKERGSNDVKTMYDIVIHDCFSGGGVPEHIFTLEFWEDLKLVIRPEGILVVNFAGMLKSDSTRMVLSTLEKSFRQCRAFHDHLGAETEYDSEFLNIVFFCTSSQPLLTFRKAQKADYLGSPLRRHMLESLPTREVNLDLIRDPLDDRHDSKYVLTDAYNPLGKLQSEQGQLHWTLMRQVLPDVYWETY